MTDFKTAGGGIPGEPGIWQIEDAWSSGDWETRGLGARAKFRFTATDPFFTAKSEKNGVRKCSGSQKLLRSDLSGTSGPKLGGRPPFSAVFEVQRRFPPESSVYRRLPPGDF